MSDVWTTSRAFVRRAVALVALASVWPTLGCSSAPDKPSLMANMAKQELTVYQLRAMDYEYAEHFAQLVAATAVDIADTTDDPDVRGRALEWRMWAMPSARSAAFDQDPLAGLIELWILAHQQHHYFSEGAGKEWFGPHQAAALRTTQSLRNDAEELIDAVMTDTQADRTRDRGGKWVAENPIEGHLQIRPTARANLASIVPVQHHGGLKAVGNMEETLRDLSDRVTILSTQTPVEVRWQAEYLVDALFEDQVQSRVDAMLDSVGKMSELLSGFDDTLSAQTQTLLAGIEEERLSVFEAVEGERDAIVAALDRGRTSILDELDSQVANATAELDAVGRGLIDHFFKRLIEVLLAMGAFVILTVVLVLVVVRRRSGSDD